MQLPSINAATLDIFSVKKFRKCWESNPGPLVVKSIFFSMRLPCQSTFMNVCVTCSHSSFWLNLEQRHGGASRLVLRRDAKRQNVAHLHARKRIFSNGGYFAAWDDFFFVAPWKMFEMKKVRTKIALKFVPTDLMIKGTIFKWSYTHFTEIN